jgi:hypothetical protein
MKRQGLSESGVSRWTHPDDYLGAMARKRSFRSRHARRARTEPEVPQMMLSTVPFLALIALLAVLAVGIMFVAYPGSQPQPAAAPIAPKELGVAPKGWFQEAQRDFHR